MVGQGSANLSQLRPSDIVVGANGSPAVQAALRWTSDQARLAGGRVPAVAAWEFPGQHCVPVGAMPGDRRTRR